MSNIREEARIIRELWDQSGAKKPSVCRYRTALDLVDAEGLSFSPAVADEALRGPMKQCFRNAGSLVLFDDPARYVYVEGFALLAKVPLCVAHAWVYDLVEEKAVEVTWPEAGTEYLGIAFETEWFRAWTTLRGTWGILDSPAFLREDVDPERYLSKNLHKKSPQGYTYR